jgi:hypothetical protein
MNAPIQKYLDPSIIANIVLKGDISGLSQPQKVEYYNHVCERLSIDPSTQPFQILKLSGKEVLYATKSAAEQLTRLYGVSHEIRNRDTVNDVHVVYVRATERDGRYEDSSGAVSIGGLKGDALANALMKAETKAKRRSTLSLLGLSMLDETEIETIPNAQPVPAPSVEKPKLSLVETAQADVVEVQAEEIKRDETDARIEEAKKEQNNVEALKQELEQIKTATQADADKLLAIWNFWLSHYNKKQISSQTWALMQETIVARRKALGMKKGSKQ